MTDRAVPDRAVPYLSAYPDEPGVSRLGSVRCVASMKGARLGLVVYPRWTVECDRMCEPFRRRTLVLAVGALRAHWREEHGWVDLDDGGTDRD